MGAGAGQNKVPIAYMRGFGMLPAWLIPFEILLHTLLVSVGWLANLADSAQCGPTMQFLVHMSMMADFAKNICCGSIQCPLICSTKG